MSAAPADKRARRRLRRRAWRAAERIYHLVTAMPETTAQMLVADLGGKRVTMLHIAAILYVYGTTEKGLTV